MYFRNIFFACIFLTQIAAAQPVNNLVKDIVMPSPNAGSLGKYGDIPVSYFTGLPNIGIPIHTVQEGPLSLSVSLSYHASGIRVAETASWVGLGWSLNAGGAISRTVQGIADDRSNGYYYSGATVPDPYNSNSGFWLTEAAEGNYDAEPDIFHFNFAGYSGKFYFDKNQVCQQIVKQDLKIEKSAGTFNGFTITTPDGTRYLFGEVTTPTARSAYEYTVSTSEPSPGSITTWYLLRVETQDKYYAIDLYYTAEAYSYRSPASCKHLYATGSACPTPPQGPAFETLVCSTDQGDDYEHRAIRTNVQGWRLSKIVTSTGIVEFVPSATDRLDLDYNYATGGTSRKSLSEIKIYPYTTGAVDNNFCSKYIFSYGYYQDPAKSTIEAKRLKLNSVQRQSCDGAITEPPHTFTYETGDLPYRLSKQTDHWGYFNGQSGNENNLINIPPTTIVIYGSVPSTYTYGSSNRNTSEAHLKRGVLKEITYPTGGKTTFTFEANTAKVAENSPRTYVPGQYWLMSCFTPADPNCCGVQKKVSKLYTFNSEDPDQIQYDLSLTRLTPTNTCNGQAPVYVATTLTIYNNSTQTIVGQYGFNLGSGQNSYTVTDYLKKIAPSLQNGVQYKFELSTTDGFAYFHMFTTTSTFVNKQVGGLRVKEIRNHDGISTANDMVRTYDYSAEGSTFSSARILQKISYVAEAPPGAVFTDVNIAPMGSFGPGYHVGYERVQENFSGNGSVVYKYYVTTEDQPPSFNYLYPNIWLKYPYPPALAVSLQGDLKSSHQYNAAGTEAASTVNVPVASNYSYSVGYMYRVTPSFCVLLNYLSGAPYVIRHLLPFRLQSVTTNIDGVATLTEYEYDAGNRFMAPAAVKITNGDGKIFSTRNKYVHDMSGAVYTEMKNRNIIYPPAEIRQEVTAAGVTTQTGGTRSNYSMFSRSTGLPTTATSNADPYPYTFQRYEMTWNNGVATAGTWDLEGTMNEYYPANSTLGKGYPKKFTPGNVAAAWPSETYEWENTLVKKRTYLAHITTYDYYPNTRLLRSITDIDGRKTGFTYDKFLRLAKTTQDNAAIDGSGAVMDGNVKTEYSYHPKTASDPYNWVKTKTTFTHVSGSNLDSTVVFEYLDGLGRLLQTVKKRWSPAQKDVVTAVAYDNQGRLVKQFTPFESVTGTGVFAPVPAAQKHILTTYESSPLNRIVSVTPPDWYATTTAYSANIGSEVGYYNGNSATSFYPAGNLNKTTVTTPQSAGRSIQTITWKDKKGRVVATRRSEVENPANKADTYTLYDDKDRVVKVLPPGVSTSTGDAGLRFEYAYDAADRMISKKVPDAAIVTMKYNNRDQLVLSQDGNLLATGKWLLTKHDDYGRPLSNGLHTATNPDPNNNTLAYSGQHTATAYGTSGINLGKITQTQTWIPAFATPITRIFTYDPVTGRMLTDNGNNHLNNATGSDNYTYVYDYAGNRLTETRTHKTSATSSTLTLTTRNTYDHAGRNTALYHRISGTGERQLAQYSYDFRDRLIDKGLGAVTAGATNSFLQSLDYAYNEQNWLTAINGNTSFSTLSQDVIALCATTPGIPNPTEAAFAADPDANDLFKLDLYYDNPGLAFGTPAPTGQRSGNISQMVWQTRGRQRQGYTLHYDYLDRLTTAYYADINAAGTATIDNKFQENIIYADARGNITSITRNGLYKTAPAATCWTLGQIDNLSYIYNTGANRLQKITDTAPTGGTGNPQRNAGFNPGSAGSTATYVYDTNGNLNSDPYKAMTLSYNHLNLPTQFNFGAGKTIDLLYDHTGKKLRKTVKPNATTTDYVQDYVNGLEYRTTGSGGTLTLEAIYHTEGRITPNGSNYQWEYSLKDHLGNTRLTFADLNANNIADVPGDILQENHYYPFGMNMNYGWLNNAGLVDNRYQYNGKELNDDYGLNWNDYGKRWYDASVGRFWGVDPIASDFAHVTPYNYAESSPIVNIDFWGLQAVNINALVREGIKITNPGITSEELNNLDAVYNEGFLKGSMGVISSTDINDVTVLLTAAGGNAKNIDGSDANGFDVGMAVLGAIIPGLSGSTIKNGIEEIANATKTVDNTSEVAKTIDNAADAAQMVGGQKALDVVEYAHKHNGATRPGYKGGGAFANDGRGGGHALPQLDADKNPVTYKEYDVNPYQKGVSRGTERVVIGSDGKAYYTNDHYKTFNEIK